MLRLSVLKITAQLISETMFSFATDVYRTAEKK